MNREEATEARDGAEPGRGAEDLAQLRALKVALVHDWLTGMRGGEKCLEVFCELLPQAHIYTLFHLAGSVSSAIEGLPIRTSFLQRFPGLRRWYRHLLPLFPLAIRRFDLSGYDAIVSLSHCVAKGAGTKGGVPHLCYCLTPMRYLWGQGPLYFHRGRYSRLSLWIIERLLDRIRRWDRCTHPDQYVAISRFVADRIERSYGRKSAVVYPPVDMRRFAPASQAHEDYYLIVSALSPYKRIELAIQALSRLGRHLLVVGKGEEEVRLRKMAAPSVTFLGWCADKEVARLFAHCRAFLLPGEEDFGITPLEAMASGRPVIALGRGGALETVVDLHETGAGAPTGILFKEPTVDSLTAAILELEEREKEFSPDALRRHAERFSRDRFRSEIAETLRRFVREETRSR